MLKPISRATFLKGLAGLSATGLVAKLYLDKLGFKTGQTFPCRILGPSMATGHMIRNGLLPKKSKRTLDTKITIIGGGIAGLSAAWWLKKHGITDFVLLELEPEVGGNSSSGKNKVSAYPWGAHYIPIPNQDSQYVRILFEELGIIERFDDKKLPVYNELYLCHEPQERLFKDGTFNEGLVPKRGLQESDQDQIGAFFNMMQKFRVDTGNDGKPAFTIPLNLSSRDPKFTDLDKMSMLDWLKSKGFSSKPLLWYVNYCCRDDYGVTAQNVSAWAGIHYFAGRKGIASNAEPNAILTWPAGNGFIVERLKEKLKGQIQSSCAVSNVRDIDGTPSDTEDTTLGSVRKNNGTTTTIKSLQSKFLTTYTNTITKECSSLRSDYVIFAAPRFLAKYICRDAVKPENHSNLVYAPWMVANITLKQIPSTDGEQIAWDNVSYYSPSLGYVVCNHQDISTRSAETVITYYYPMSDKSPLEARRELQKASADHWQKLIVEDLDKMHPGIKDSIMSIDLCPWGHGMISPSVGFIWGETRKQMQEPCGNLYFAHSDMSGISNFEEAQYHGVTAAQNILSRIT